jgi:hypothetical protein
MKAWLIIWLSAGKALWQGFVAALKAAWLRVVAKLPQNVRVSWCGNPLYDGLRGRAVLGRSRCAWFAWIVIHWVVNA